MPCELCLIDPSTHSFELITHHTTTEKIHIFYSSYKNIKDYSNSETVIRHFEETFVPIGKEPWGWVIDCKYLSAKHMVHVSLFISIIKLLTAKYSGTQRFIYLINGGPITNTAILTCKPFIKKTVYDAIVRLYGTPLELFEQFKKLGWTVGEVQPIIKRLQTDY
jgi:CRAL/TRIO domain